MSKIEFEKSKAKYLSIDIPQRLDEIIDNAIARVEKRKRRLFYQPVIITAASILIFILTVNVSPAFATYLSKVPGLSDLVYIIRFDKGLKTAIDNGIVQVINKSCEDKGIKFTIDNVIPDKRRIIIAYTIETSGQYDDLSPAFVNITDDKGEHLKAVVIIDRVYDPKFKENKIKKGTIDISNIENEIFPEDIGMTISKFEEGFGAKSKIIEGLWETKFQLGKSLLDIKPKELTINKDVSIDYMKFNIENISIYPTIVDAKINMDKNNKFKYVLFKNPVLGDEKGNRYPTLSGSTSWVSSDEIVMHFQSNYFIDAKQLYFKADGIYCIPKENDEIIVDLENKKVINDGGCNVEYLYDRQNEVYGNEKYDFHLSLKVKDKEIINMLKSGNTLVGGLWFDQNIYDENGNKYDRNGDTFSEYFENGEEYFERGINIKSMSKIPKLLKLKITGAAKGIMKPINIRVK